ncbi:MAG: hypothetical protein ACOX02_00880 [Acholeplasmatales bacterium]
MVVLTINIPEGKEITSLKINGEEQINSLDNNRIAFEIICDTVVYLGLKDAEIISDVYYSLTLPERGFFKSRK